MQTVGDIVDALGGTRATVEALRRLRGHLRISDGSVYMWRSRGRIPDCWHAALIEAFAEKGQAVSPALLSGLSQTNDRAA